MSSGVPSRLSAIRSTSWRCPSSPYDSHWRSVAAIGADEAGRDVVDGDSPRPELVRELARETDLRRLRRRVRLDAGEADTESRAARDVDDAPVRAAFIDGATACDMKNAPETFTSKMRLPVARRDLFERTSDLAEDAAGVVDENVDSLGGADFTDEAIDGALVDDVHDVASHFPPAETQRSRVSRSSSPRMSHAQTVAPRSAKARAIARPKPCAAPVTNAVRPLKSTFTRQRSGVAPCAGEQ